MRRPLLCLAFLTLGAMPALAQPDLASLEKDVKKLHLAAQGERCRPIEEAFDPAEAYQAYTLEWVPDSEGAAPETIHLFRLFCDLGAYNVSHAYYWWRDFEGLQPLHFAMPTFETEYEKPDDIDSPLVGVELTGMTTTNVLVNSSFDESIDTFTSHSLWRGLGDASSQGTWIFEDGQVVLKLYDVDASYDGEANLETLVDYFAGRP